VNGVTTSSWLVSMTVYETPGRVSPPALSATRNAEPWICSWHAGQETKTPPARTPTPGPARVASPFAVVP
jgi:hypothetical protein